jgi:hypothetical protein
MVIVGCLQLGIQRSNPLTGSKEAARAGGLLVLMLVLPARLLRSARNRRLLLN